MSKHLELARKLKALSEKGVGGEKINAEKMLNDLIKKHNIKLEDLEGEEINNYFFKIETEDYRLFCQIVGRVNHLIKIFGEFSKRQMKEYGVKGNYAIKCTASEYIEIESMFPIYKRLYQEELKVFFRAFCTANDLLVDSGTQRSTKELTQEEYQEWLRATAMASNVKSETFRKQLTEQ